MTDKQMLNLYRCIIRKAIYKSYNNDISSGKVFYDLKRDLATNGLELDILSQDQDPTIYDITYSKLIDHYIEGNPIPVTIEGEQIVDDKDT